MTVHAGILIFLSVVALLSVNSFGSNQNSGEQPSPQFAELRPIDATALEKQRAIVASAAKQRYGTASLSKTKSDLPILQRLIDNKVFSKSQTYELQSLGVAFGDVLASELSLHWEMVTDEYGTDPTLRYKQTTIQINALTMISKRVERGDNVNLSELLRFTREHIDSMVKRGYL